MLFFFAIDLRVPGHFKARSSVNGDQTGMRSACRRERSCALRLRHDRGALRARVQTTGTQVRTGVTLPAGERVAAMDDRWFREQPENLRR
jgi:hypothetical protein